VKIKLLIPIVLVMLLSSSTIAIAAKPSDLPEQANLKGQKEDIEEFLIYNFIEILTRIYDKKNWVPLALEDRITAITGR
jgi:hypothetical protein